MLRPDSDLVFVLTPNPDVELLQGFTSSINELESGPAMMAPPGAEPLREKSGSPFRALHSGAVHAGRPVAGPKFLRVATDNPRKCVGPARAIRSIRRPIQSGDAHAEQEPEERVTDVKQFGPGSEVVLARELLD